MTRPDLTPSAQRVFAFFWQCTHQRRPMKQLFMGEKTIAAETFLTVRSVRRALRTLEDAGLLTTYHRPRRHAMHARDLTTNRYVIHWHPYTATEIDPMDVSQALVPEYAHSSSLETPSATADLEVPADVSFVSGGERTGCPEGSASETPETRMPIDSENTKPAPIEDPGFKQEFDQQDGSPVWRFSTPQALLLFLLSHLKTRGIGPVTLRKWIQSYSLSRVAEVSQWVLSAPQGAIKNPGAWMRSALEHEWTAPSWVREATRKRALARQEREYQRTLARRARQEDAARDEIREARAREDIVWMQYGARLEQDQTVVAKATRLAQEALGPAAAALFRPGTVLWRQFTMRAGEELGIIAADGVA
ncbi:hypothetical protein [Sulfobacillus harzensis]|uniref:Helix-turn-helix domain-containing protein n=1 Tax=Sulfobacillus harzensis TaxID=2729629 RepID=A0A7Y0L6C8_9FIRM|nr:hypothetical protein [Sulfobacillus harzensis]NMP23561.1 helix-turn-helix domain-containing protein [Sulfobacillus harzensis]